ncbi:hypothetical protein A2335_01715 [Candidatus Peregrinibacteria bacterium RIFOXYB2_FULL_32_7]|nr:MAG: hypothetical protein A2335_01715 [Candidatus Peregrinibacteria bacterium RIFOXYB2_FULL_32_7]
MFVDTHCHLNVENFAKDFDEVLKRMKKAGISQVINVGCDLKTSQKGIDLAEKYDFMYATVGLHPHEAKDFTSDLWANLESLAQNKRVIAIGEAGLDFYRNLSTKEEQEKVFKKQCDLAKNLDLPLIIHCRDAYEEMYKILVQEKAKKVIFHCFAGNLEFAKKIWDRGWASAFGGMLTYPKNEDLRVIAKICPDDLWLIETDCPYLSPQKFRSERNEPAYMIETAKVLAELKRVDLQDLGKIEERNVEKIFGIKAPSKK